jgi:hypothetical protein
MVFNATFNNISAISRRSVLLVEETGVPGENHPPAVSHWQIYSILFYWVCYAMSGVRTHNVSGYIHWLHRKLYIHLLYVHDRRRPLKVKKKENTRKQIKTKGYTPPGLRVVDKENDLNTSKGKYSTQKGKFWSGKRYIPMLRAVEYFKQVRI